jgi:riboflavin synthase alpha subunit
MATPTSQIYEEIWAFVIQLAFTISPYQKYKLAFTVSLIPKSQHTTSTSLVYEEIWAFTMQLAFAVSPYKKYKLAFTVSLIPKTQHTTTCHTTSDLSSIEIYI